MEPEIVCGGPVALKDLGAKGFPFDCLTFGMVNVNIWPSSIKTLCCF